MKGSIESYFNNPKNLKTKKVYEDDISKKLLCEASTSTEINKDVEDFNNSFGDILASNYEEEQLQDSSNNDSNNSGEHVSCATFVDSVDINASIDSFSCTLEISKTTPGPKDLAQHLDDGPKQPILVFYPKTMFSNRMRHFSDKWYKMFNWIEYSIMDDAVFCFPCRFFSKYYDLHTVFITIGFKQWKKALDKSSGFKQHESSSEHKKCQLVKENRKYIQYIGKALFFTAVQGIDQREDDESENGVNRGNFLELVHLLEYFNDDFKQKKQSLPNNSKYIIPSMQNEILTVFGQMVRDKISNELQKCEYFAIMVDETKDISKIEQLSVILRYYLDGIVYERFMGFRAAGSLCATSLFTYIKEILTISNVDIKKCVGQTYDGTNVMSGKFNGVQALFAKKCHRLYMCIVTIIA
ncbi:zinc finger MYM-type protein 1-like [Rhopalosiphum maidis]|uniref:zinc finger MYM-type protein 1-like n=1 Tax=Rhopalosiphum maidis TaxID=43146 RepID=UPI000EFE431E|nr:zinc finger MYM-type protein 1-like [Rhopalosiphum maidis]